MASFYLLYVLTPTFARFIKETENGGGCKTSGY
jgi:hypothetical protein